MAKKLRELYNSKQVCEELGIHHNTLYRMRNKGMPVVKMGRNYRYDMDKIYAWLEERGK